MIHLIENVLTVEKNGRFVKVQRVTEADTYKALRAFGASDAQAQAAQALLITIDFRKLENNAR